MRKGVRGVGILTLGVLLVGCAGSPPMQNHEYLLRPDSPPAAVPGDVPVRLKSVLIPPYLDRSGLVLQTGPSEIRVARHHRWAEPLDESVQRYLQVEIARQSGRSVETSPLSDTGGRDVVTIRIHQFHGTESGRVRLVADWRLAAADGESVIRDFDRTLTQGSNGYPALVAAHAELLDELAAAIAADLEG